MPDIYCSTGAMVSKKTGYDHSILMEVYPHVPYRGFEVLMFDHFARHPEEYEPIFQILMKMKGAGVNFYSVHTNKAIGELVSRNQPGDVERALEVFKSDCAYATRLGARLLVMHLWGGIESDRDIETNIRAFPRFKAIADAQGLVLTVENIVCNYQSAIVHMKRLWELYPRDVLFTVDVRQAEFHKALVDVCESAFLWKNNLVPHIHISDYRGGAKDWAALRTAPPNTTGDVDFAYFFDFLRSVGFSGSVTDENGRVAEDLGWVENLNRSYAFIRRGLCDNRNNSMNENSDSLG